VPELPERVYHLADEANWPSIWREGLLCTATLLRRAGIAEAGIAAPRARAEVLSTGVRIRDQKPIPEKALASCLDAGLTPADWYRILAEHVFFWADGARLRRHLAAQGGRPTRLLVFDSHGLAQRYAGAVFVTPFNIGSALRRPAPRGRRTLAPLSSWRADGWRSEALPSAPVRRAASPPAELVVRGDVPDALDFLVEQGPVSVEALADRL
jgi:hypothetical protein